MKHELKIHPQHYARVKAGTKTFELRNNDRAFQKYDEVVLREYEPRGDKGVYTNNPNLHFTIGDVYPIDAERVVFGLIEVDE